MTVITVAITVAMRTNAKRRRMSKMLPVNSRLVWLLLPMRDIRKLIWIALAHSYIGGFSHCLVGHDYCDDAGKGDKEDRHAWSWASRLIWQKYLCRWADLSSKHLFYTSAAYFPQGWTLKIHCTTYIHQQYYQHNINLTIFGRKAVFCNVPCSPKNPNFLSNAQIISTFR